MRNIISKLNSHVALRKKAERIAKIVKGKQAKIYEKMKDEELFNQTYHFKKLLASGKTLDDILVDAYAVACEVSKRIAKLNPFHVQVMGAYIMHGGDIIEMKTGEGKTITSVMPAYLNALLGNGVHITTVNEYLVQRDAEEMGAIHQKLHLTIGVNLQRKNRAAKKLAYQQDITYSVHSELGFDYLRDNMVENFNQKTQRGHWFVIVDEVDSILIDEARTPLIISSQAVETKETYERADQYAKTLTKDDYVIDEESRGISLTPQGVAKTEKYFNIQNLYDVRNTELTHRINNALKANYVFARDVEYMVADDKIFLIDQFTGRIMEGRSYSYGLQQAIQAKEGVEIEQETMTSATITYQNYFRLYNKISGMTGTAKTEEEEFTEVYNMRVVEIPTNKPLIRLDDKDLVFGTKKAKLKAIVQRVKELYKVGRPVLLGTTKVTDSLIISKLIEKEKIPHNVLNAKNHAIEGKIIAQAGQLKQVTIATNMAGRGTDIKLGKGVVELGGLVVLGTEKHEARRIDNQLRGRSGRQGDPGYSQFYVSIEDDLMSRFGGPLIKRIFSSLEDDAINSRTLTRALLSTQKRIEGMNFEARKDVLNYDNVLTNQRKIMYKQRDKILLVKDMKEIVSQQIKQIVRDFLDIFKKKEDLEEVIDYKKIMKILNNKLIKPGSITVENLKNHTIEEIKEMIHREILKMYLEKRQKYDPKVINELERMLILRILDQIWMHHINSMDKLRRGIHLQSISQKNPVQLYIKKAHSLFDDTKKQIAHRCILAIFASKIKVEQELARKNREEAEANQLRDLNLPISSGPISVKTTPHNSWGPVPQENKWETIPQQKQLEPQEEEKPNQNELKNTDPTKGWT